MNKQMIIGGLTFITAAAVGYLGWKRVRDKQGEQVEVIKED